MLQYSVNESHIKNRGGTFKLQKLLLLCHGCHSSVIVKLIYIKKKLLIQEIRNLCHIQQGVLINDILKTTVDCLHVDACNCKKLHDVSPQTLS